MSTSVRTFFQLVILLVFFCIFVPSAQATSYDLGTTTNWHVRWDGAAASDGLPSIGGMAATDINNDGKQDTIIASRDTDNNSRASSGSVWIIYNDLFNTINSTGNTIDLSDSSKWNIRIDGAVAGDELSRAALTTADVDNDGKQDLLIGAYNAGFNSRSSSGSLYVIYNTLLDDYTGTGNTVDLNTATNYSLRYDAAAANTWLTLGGLTTADIDANGKTDLLIGAARADFNSRTDSGSLYVVYDSLVDDYSGKGNNIDLNTATNYNLRYDAPVGGEVFTEGSLAAADLDNDGKIDIVGGADLADNNSRTNSGSVWVVYNSLIDDYSGTGNIIDLATTTNWNLRFDGAAASNVLGATTGSNTGDVNSDGKIDLLLNATQTSNNSRSSSGSMYIIYNSIIDDYSGTGNTIDLSGTSTFSLRFDGDVASGFFPREGGVVVADINNSGKNDLYFGVRESDPSSRSDAGTQWIIYDTIIDDYSGTGNSIDLAQSSSYTHRYIGPAANDRLSSGTIIAKDLNSDGSLDLLQGVNGTDNNSRNASGSIYLTYNFPHAITLNDYSATSADSFKVTGTVSASNSVTNITAVEFLVDSNSPTGSWTACTPTAGAFDGYSEDFTCTIPKQTQEYHTLYIRAQDSNGAYTARTSYATSRFDLRPGMSKPSSSHTGSSTPPARAWEGAVLSAYNIRAVLQKNSIRFDTTLSIERFDLPARFCGFQPVSGVYSIWLRDFYNGARILPTLHQKPSMMTLRDDLFTTTDLQITYSESFDPLSIRCSWKRLPTAVDPTNRTVAAIHTIGGYYMVTRGTTSQLSTASPDLLGVRDKDSKVRHTTKKTAPRKQSLRSSGTNSQKSAPENSSYIDRIIQFLKARLSL